MTEYRIILTATFASVEDRDTLYDRVKTALGTAKTGLNIKRADMTKDDYTVPDVGMSTEKVI